MEYVMDITPNFQMNLLMRYTYIIGERVSEMNQNVEVYLDLMYSQQDSMMHITKKLLKYERLFAKTLQEHLQKLMSS